MLCEGYQAPVWKAGEVVPAGTYVRIDDESYRKITLQQVGPLPASFDGHVACYRAAARFLGGHRPRRELVGVAQETSRNHKRSQGEQAFL